MRPTNLFPKFSAGVRRDSADGKECHHTDCNIWKEPPTELSELSLDASANTVGYVLFSFLKSGMTDASRARAVSLLSQFRVYLHYHIKASKTYLHMRMRKRVNTWLQVLNRAKPEYKDETKVGSKTASGRTFIKK